MRIHHLNCGTMCPWPSAFVGGGGDRWARGRMVCHCLLVEAKAGLLLVDTGMGTPDVASPSRLPWSFRTMTGAVCRQDETALAQVARLGFARDDVRHILTTHLDLDHAGGLSDFPDAAVHVHADEHAAAMTRSDANARNRYIPAQWRHGPRWTLHRPAGERWFGFEGVRPIAGTDDEVLLIPLHGHTRGHSGIAVRTDHGWLLHAGDAYFAHDEVWSASGSCPPGLELFQRLVAVDGQARLANRDRLRQLARQHGSEVQIICAHSPDELDAAELPAAQAAS